MGVSKVIINGVTKIDITSDTVAANKLLSGYTAHGADGESVSGSIASKTSSDLSVSGATVTAPAGYYSSDASKSVASGTEGTPVATKGTVSNHSVSVTPSVTNTTGYITGSTKTGTAVTVSASELVSGTKSISSNGSDIDVTNYASVDVDVQPSLEAVTDVDPTESSQTITAGSSYDGLSSVQINAIPSDYIGSDIPQNDSSDLTASGATVTAPAGYYAENATKTIASGSATTPATTISVTPSISIDSSTGVITASASGSQSITPTISAGYVSSGTSGTVSVSGSNTSSLTTQAATTYTPGTSDQTIAAGTYLTGAQTISGDADLIAANIVEGVTIFGVTGIAEQPTAMTAAQILAAVQAGWV